jgi:hypothetical protein
MSKQDGSAGRDLGTAHLARRVAFGALFVLLAVPFPCQAQAQGATPHASSDDEEGQKRERAALLDLHIGDELERDVRAPLAVNIALSSLGTAGSVLLIPADKGIGITWTSTFAVSTAAYAAAALGDENTQVATGQAIGFLPLGGMTLGLALADRETLLPRLAAGGAGAGFIGFSALAALNMLLWRHVPLTTLRADRARLRTPEQRAALSTDETARIERDFLSFERPIPSWALSLPLFIGGSVALVPALEKNMAAGDRAWSVGYSAVTLLMGVGIAAASSPIAAYVSDVQRVGLRVTPLASRDAVGVGVAGTF